MSEVLNATCSICGEKYHVCNSCRNTKSFTPWRSVADSINCYKIYTIVHEYTYKVLTKKQAREKLNDCIMPKTFQLHIKTVIDEIMQDNDMLAGNETVIEKESNTEIKKIKYKKGVSNKDTTNNEQ